MSSRLLGLAGSFRSVITGNLGKVLCSELVRIKDKNALLEYLTINSILPPLEDLSKFSTCSKETLGLYNALRELKRRKGMSNSEAALAVALWEAHKLGVEIEYVALSDFFASQRGTQLEELKKTIEAADGILVAGPVYFGDRSSSVQDLNSLIRLDECFRKTLQGKLFGGIAVGAKRNGGQETTLIYQLLDMVYQGMLAVGNDSETTSQYGGTCCAGDVGSLGKDGYGLNTAMGTGRRLAKLLKMYEYKGKLRDKLKILFLILQDSDNIALNYLQDLIKRFDDAIEPTVLSVVGKDITRCLACDICPLRVDIDEVYRRKIDDYFAVLHRHFLNHDAIVPVALSLNDYSKITSNYQKFMERTRYLRRGDYLFTDTMVSPLIFQEIGSTENLHIRMITSFIRHHTVICKPIIGYLVNETLFNFKEIINDFEIFISHARRLAVARLSGVAKGGSITHYNPVGYVLSASNEMDNLLEKRKRIVLARESRLQKEFKKRVMEES